VKAFLNKIPLIPLDVTTLLLIFVIRVVVMNQTNWQLVLKLRILLFSAAHLMQN